MRVQKPKGTVDILPEQPETDRGNDVEERVPECLQNIRAQKHIGIIFKLRIREKPCYRHMIDAVQPVPAVALQ